MEIIPDTIDLKQLWFLFSRIKTIPYGQVLKYPSGFEADAEMVFYALQKELFAQSLIGKN